MPDLFESGFFADRPAWHGKGRVIRGAATAEEALVLAGQDWTVSKKPVELNGKPIPSFYATVRDDTNAVLGVVGQNYAVIQNDQLYEFLNPVISAGEAVYETAGVLLGGRRVWALAKLPQHYVVVPDDLVHQYLLVASSHDGSLGYMVTWTDIRVVCWNTLTMALNLAERDRRAVVSIRHAANYRYYLQVAHQVMGLASASMQVASDLFMSLAHSPMSSALADQFVRAMFPSRKEEEQGVPGAVVEHTRDEVLSYFDLSMNNPRGAEHSGWSMYNALTHWTDHAQPRRRGVDRQNWSWFSGGQQLRSQALNWLSSNLLRKEL